MIETEIDNMEKDIETRLSYQGMKLDDYLSKQDMENYAILVHAMKSDSKYLGFTKLAELAYEHELASKANNVDEVKTKFADLMEEAERITNVAKEYLK